MADLPFPVEAALADRLARALDTEGKILRALEALGPVAGRDVLLVGESSTVRCRQLVELGARVEPIDRLVPSAGPAASADVIVSTWSGFRGVDEADLAEADRLLRPGGRLLVVHDYGRDDVSRLRGDLPEYGAWSRRDGPFLRNGFKIRVVHCWWTFDSLEDAADFLDAAFGPAGGTVAAELKRPRLSYNVAVYHRSRGETSLP